MARLVSFDTVWTEITKAYNPAFLKALMEIPGARVYAFGGIITDLSLERPWKDLDVRVIWDTPRDVQEREIIRVLEQHVDIVQKFVFVDGLVFRVREPNGKNMIIDIGVANNFGVFISDFTACSIFMDLKTGEIAEMYPNSIHDLEQEIVRMDPKVYGELEKYPFYPLRALKLATKGNFTIDPDFGAFLKTKGAYVQRAMNELTAYIRKNGKDSVAEFYLGNIFGGFKSNASRYAELLEEYGYLREMCLALQEPFGTKQMPVVVPSHLLERFIITETLEQKLSLLVSVIAHSISNTPIECFTALVHAFAFDTDRSDGNEFVVDPTKIVFVS